MRRIYMDHTAGKPVDKRVLKTMMLYFTESIGNPSSPHSFGNEARSAINESRKKVSSVGRDRFFGNRFDDVLAIGKSDRG